MAEISVIEGTITYDLYLRADCEKADWKNDSTSQPAFWVLDQVDTTKVMWEFVSYPLQMMTWFRAFNSRPPSQDYLSLDFEARRYVA
ncbi:hypothetical protein PM082_023220 [Marasmius tenuissimus]|nr:hypothetical protein PM082_023220 [Marasmius tenuissimus]